MFDGDWQKGNVKKRIMKAIMFIGVILTILTFLATTGCTNSNSNAPTSNTEDFNPENMIRFHLIANSDSNEDQLLKYAIRDEILKIAAPRLAESESPEESRKILKEMEEQLLYIARTVMQDLGINYDVTVDHGKHIFPTISYGSIILPGGEYEAVKIKIGEAKGENWWCVLFPAICFVNVEELTTVAVDGKPGVPLNTACTVENVKKPKVRFYLARFLK